MISLTKLGRMVGDFPYTNYNEHSHGVYFGSLYSNVTEVSGAYNFTNDFHLFLKVIDVRNPEAPNFEGMHFYLFEEVTDYTFEVFKERDFESHGITITGEDHLEQTGETRTVNKWEMNLSDYSYEEFTDSNGEKWFKSTTPVATYDVTKYPYAVTGDDDVIHWSSNYVTVRCITLEEDFDTIRYWAAYVNGAWVEQSETTTTTKTTRDKIYYVIPEWYSQSGFSLESNLTGIANNTIEPFSRFSSNNLSDEDDYAFRPTYILTHDATADFNKGIIAKDLVGHRGFVQTETIFKDWTATLDDEPDLTLVSNPYEDIEGYIEIERLNNKRTLILMGEGDILLHTYIITLTEPITDWVQYIRDNLRDFTDYDPWVMYHHDWVAWDYRDVPNILDVHQKMNTIWATRTGWSVTGYGGSYYAHESELTYTYNYSDAGDWSCSLLLMDNTGALSIQTVTFDDLGDTSAYWKQYGFTLPTDKYLVSAYNLNMPMEAFDATYNGGTLRPIIFMKEPIA